MYVAAILFSRSTLHRETLPCLPNIYCRTLCAFSRYNFDPSLTIDDTYFNGLSIMYGSAPCKHIWTYASTGLLTLDYNVLSTSALVFKKYDCPCTKNSIAIAPSFIHNDYYCESRMSNCGSYDAVLNNPLWDEQPCNNLEGTCCTHPTCRGSSRHSMRPPLRILS